MAEDAPEFWRRARSQYHVNSEPIECPVAHELALHLIDTLMEDEFDIVQATRLAKATRSATCISG